MPSPQKRILIADAHPTMASGVRLLLKDMFEVSVIYIGPKAPKGKESNWLYTPIGQKWFPWFRLYGPEKAVFDKSWKLPDIEKVN